MRLRITLEGTSYEVGVEVLPEDGNAPLEDDAQAVVPESVLQPPRLPDSRPEDKICRSPIAGVVIALAAKPGEWVRQDDPVVVIEAMKMQNTIGAPVDGIVEEVLVKLGDAVKSGQIICKIS